MAARTKVAQEARLSKESADALRRCLHILAPKYNPAQRDELATFVEHFCIENGKWPTSWGAEDLSMLWFPGDTRKAARLRAMLESAAEAGDLSRMGVSANIFTASNLACWANCPALPADSPLIHWLPEWMQKLKPLDAPLPAEQEVKWEDEAREIAKELYDIDGDRSSLDGYAARVAEKMQQRGRRGPQGRFLSKGTIKRDALQGEKWWRHRKK